MMTLKVLEQVPGRRNPSRVKRQGQWYEVFDEEVKRLKRKAVLAKKEYRTATDDEHRREALHRYSNLKRCAKRRLK